MNIVKPELCMGCRFCNIATVTLRSGREQRMLNCSRLDCDNWQEQDDAEPVERFTVDGELR